MFVAIEGIDGSGKTTLSEKVFDKLISAGYSVELTREPTERFRITGEESESDSVDTALDLFFRFTSDRFVHQRSIEKALNYGKIVITDRYLASSLAYQGARLEALFGSREKTIGWMMEVSRPISVLPDITIYIDIDPETAMRRISGRSSISGFENGAYLSRVREYYLRLLGERTLLLDGREEPDKLAQKAAEYIIKELTGSA